MQVIQRCGLISVFILWVCSAAGGIFSNVLRNGGFELDTNDAGYAWTPLGNAWRQGLPAHSGANAGKLFGNWGEATNFTYFYQIVPASRGQVWTGTAWGYNPPGDEMRGENRAYVTVGFLDAASNGILYCASPKQITAGSPTNEWFPLSVSSRAPWSTAYATFILAFMQVTNAGGSARFDDCEFGLADTNRLRFAGRDWDIFDWGWDWVNRTNSIVCSTNCAWVDTNGWLHMAIRNFDGRWWCSQVESIDWLGYGEYSWSIDAPLDKLESNTIVGLFFFDEPRGVTNYEIDIEVSRALIGGGRSNLLYTVQPWYIPENGYQTPMVLTNSTTTHRFQWTPGKARWQGYYGHGGEPISSNHVFAERVYVSDNVPVPPARCEINFWLCEGLAPSDTQYLEIVVKDFRFKPFEGVLLRDEFGDGSRSNVWFEFGYSDHEIEETNDCLRVRPGLYWETAGYMTAREMGWGAGALAYTFSAVLKTVRVDMAQSGDDVAAVLSFCSEKDNAWVSTNAFTIESLYDSGGDRLTVIFFTKDRLPGTWGRTNFAGTVTNASRYFSGGGVELSLTLNGSSYALAVRETNGLPVSMNIDSGSVTGLHGLSWRLDHGYWQVGAWNADPARGSVFWDRTEIRVDTPREDPFRIDLASAGGQTRLSWSGSFYRAYSVMKSTNLAQGFQPYATNICDMPSLNLYTDVMNSAGAVFYWIGSSADVLR